MPSYYDLPIGGNAQVPNQLPENVDKFNKLPFYLVMNEVKKFPIYKTWDVLFGKQKWTPNMGSIMRGVRPENSPIGDTFVYPQNITGVPNKNVFETLESTEEARVKLHRFESRPFHFLPSFQDFRENQLQFNHDDIIRQIALYNERFIRGMVFYRSPIGYICGNNGSASNRLGVNNFVTGLPTNDPASNIPGTGKVTGFMQEVAGSIGSGLTLRCVYNACQVFDEDVRAPYFEGTVNTPRENELVKGKYVLICGSEIWRSFFLDPLVNQLKSIYLDLLFDGFKGSLFGQVTVKPEKFPIRFADDGTFQAPEITDNATNKTRPNPLYTSLTASPYEVAFLVGAEAWKTISVGPPPREFTGKSMASEKFYSLKWSGEVQMTDQVLMRYDDGTYDLNKYGTLLQLISQSVFGALAGEINNVMPIYYRRTRIPTLV
jgi:hypothetical protein